MYLTVNEIAEFCAKQLKKVFNEEFNIYEDNLVDKVKMFLLNEFEIDFTCTNEYIVSILEDIQCLNLELLIKDKEGNIIENIDEEYINQVKGSISLYCIYNYAFMKNYVDEAAIRYRIEAIKQQYDEMKYILDENCDEKIKEQKYRELMQKIDEESYIQELNQEDEETEQ